MDELTKARRVGAWAVACAVILRLFAAGVPMAVYSLVAAKLAEKETEHPARSESYDWFEFLPESAPPELPKVPQLPRFTGEEGVALTDSVKAKPDVPALLAQPLEWKLCSAEPTVLILHTHATESYRKQGEDYRETVAYRTRDEDFNMLSIGDRVAQVLEAGGVHVVHDRTLHDDPDYNTAYSHARKGIRAILAEHPSICLILDIHRDALEDKKGNQLPVRVQLGEASAAQLMLVMGTGNAGANNPYYQDNLALGLKLSAVLEQQNPGLTRPVSLRSQRFNQDLQANTLLVEIGAAGNTHAEALLTAQKLAEAILYLKDGTQ